MDLSKYYYIANKTGYEIYYDGKLIAGLSINLSLYPNLNGLYIEYHRQQAKEKLKELINEARNY